MSGKCPTFPTHVSRISHVPHIFFNFHTLPTHFPHLSTQVVVVPLILSLQCKENFGCVLTGAGITGRMARSPSGMRASKIAINLPATDLLLAAILVGRTRRESNSSKKILPNTSPKFLNKSPNRLFIDPAVNSHIKVQSVHVHKNIGSRT